MTLFDISSRRLGIYAIFEMHFFPFLNIFQCFSCDRLPCSCSFITQKNDNPEKFTTEKNKEMNFLQSCDVFFESCGLHFLVS